MRLTRVYHDPFKEAPAVAAAREVRLRANGGRIIPSNIDGDPSEKKKKAGNYAKEHIRIHGLDITIEVAKGMERKGVGKNGRPWSVEMPAHYGYIKRTEGKDGDNVDCYFGGDLESKKVFVINQIDPDRGNFDEHKCMLGFNDEKEAREAYEAAFSDGKGAKRIGHVTECTMDEFKEWLKNKNDTKKPLIRNKVSKLSVEYSEGMQYSHCGICKYYTDHSCMLVRGHIKPEMWCKLFEKKIGRQVGGRVTSESDAGLFGRHRLDLSVPVKDGFDITGRAYVTPTYPEPRRSDFGIMGGIRKKFQDGGAPEGLPGYPDVPGTGPERVSLGPSWLERAQAQAQADAEAYQLGGVHALMENTEDTQGLAGGFGGTINLPRGISRGLRPFGLTAENQNIPSYGGQPRSKTATVDRLIQDMVRAHHEKTDLAEALKDIPQSARLDIALRIAQLKRAAQPPEPPRPPPTAAERMAERAEAAQAERYFLGEKARREGTWRHMSVEHPELDRHGRQVDPNAPYMIRDANTGELVGTAKTYEHAHELAELAAIGRDFTPPKSSGGRVGMQDGGIPPEELPGYPVEGFAPRLPEMPPPQLPMEQSLTEYQMGTLPHIEGVAPKNLQVDELGRIVDVSTPEWNPVQFEPRPDVLPLAKSGPAIPKMLDIAGNIVGGIGFGRSVGPGPVLGSGLIRKPKQPTEVPHAGPEIPAPATEAVPPDVGSPHGRPGGNGGDPRVAEAQRAAETAAGPLQPIEGLPTKPIELLSGDYYVPGPMERVHLVADEYMKEAGIPYEPVREYMPVNEQRAGRIAGAFDQMKHDPSNPEVAAAYDAMINETVAQFKAIEKSGLQIEFIKPGMADPYYETPRLAAKDVRDNNHLWVFPTESGFGTLNAVVDNPLLRRTGITVDGKELLANDVFRIVHDYFGHLKDGVGFRAAGEENAWRSHSRMYSPLARKAMTTETRGQNSWLNYGPHGEANRTAKSDQTIFADQKIGILPDWVVNEGAADPYTRTARTSSGNLIFNMGPTGPTHPAQTVAAPHRMMFPGIYESPKRIAREAAQHVAPESPALKQLWGVTRGDLDEMAKGRIGNEPPDVMPAGARARGALSAQNIQTPRNTQRMIDILAEAGKYPGLRHMDAWYIMDPVFQRMVQLVGPEQAVKDFRQLNAAMGFHSPASDVLTEITRGTHANMALKQGRFEEYARYGGIPEEFRRGDFPKDLRAVPAHPYHRTAHVEPFQKYLQEGKATSPQPKVRTYVHASGVPETGFQTTGMVGDAHFSRGVGLADTRKGPTDIAASLTPSEYHTVQPWWQHEVAGKVGLESVPAQARGWGALAQRTGVESPVGQSKLELFSVQIMKAAKRLGVSPEKARDMILLGKAGAGVMAAVVAGMQGKDQWGDDMALGGGIKLTPVAHDPFEYRKAIRRAMLRIGD